MKFDKTLQQSSGAGGANFLKVKDGEKVVGVFRGDPLMFQQHWIGTHGEICQGSGCPHCISGNRASYRFHINFITKDDKGQYVAKIFTGGKKIYNALSMLNDEYELEKTIVSITRSGSTKDDTVYTIMPIKEHTVTPDKEKAIGAIALLELNPAKFKPAPVSDAVTETTPF